MFKKILLLTVFFLSACASDPTNLYFKQGRANFGVQNYGLAFQQLYPAALRENPEAQYAIGFMYYYGYGTAKNMDFAHGWISKSAAHGYPPAIKALALMNNQVWVNRK